eukprot:95649_1
MKGTCVCVNMRKRWTQQMINLINHHIINIITQHMTKINALTIIILITHWKLALMFNTTYDVVVGFNINCSSSSSSSSSGSSSSSRSSIGCEYMCILCAIVNKMTTTEERENA